WSGNDLGIGFVVHSGVQRVLGDAQLKSRRSHVLGEQLDLIGVEESGTARLDLAGNAILVAVAEADVVRARLNERPCRGKPSQQQYPADGGQLVRCARTRAHGDSFLLSRI